MSKVTLTVGQLVNEKGKHIWSIEPGKTVYEGLQLMADKNVGALLVMEDGKVVGIVSERDYARKVILLGKISKETKISEAMSKDVCYVTPDKNIEECMALFTNKRVRHLPVMEGEELIGLISMGDIVSKIISEQKFAIGELENYIS
jgi:CBS domain-containing protein